MIDLISRKKVIEALTDKVKQLRDMAEGIETWDGTLIGSRIAGIEHAIMYLQTEPSVDVASMLHDEMFGKTIEVFTQQYINARFNELIPDDDLIPYSLYVTSERMKYERKEEE